MGPAMLEELCHLFDVTQMQALIYATELVNWGRIRSHDFSKEMSLMEELLLNDPLPQNKRYLYDLYQLIRHPTIDLAEDLKIDFLVENLIPVKKFIPLQPCT